MRIALAMGAVLLLVVTLGAVTRQPGTQETVRTQDTQVLSPADIPELVVTQEVVRTKNLQIVDDDGNVRADFTLIEGKPTLDLFGEDGKTLASLALVDAAPGISPAEGEPGLFLYDKDGKLRASLALQDGNPLLVTWDAHGNVHY